MFANNQEQLNQLKYLIKKEHNLNKISQVLNISLTNLLYLIAELNHENYQYQINGEEVINLNCLHEPPLYTVPKLQDNYRLLIISDTHLGCKQDRLDLLNYVYEMAEKNNIDYIIHCGDVTDGISDYEDHLANLRFATFDEQRDYVITNYPHSYIPTFMVSGNHDNWWRTKISRDILSEITDTRSDLTYLGDSEAFLRLGDLNLFIIHGHHNLKKSLQKGSSIPINYIFKGHHHYSDITTIDNHTIIQCPALVDERIHPFSENKNSDKGIWWLEIDSLNPKEFLLNSNLETFNQRKLIKNRTHY